MERTPTAANRAFMKSGVGAAGLKLPNVCKTSRSQDWRSSLAAVTALPFASGNSASCIPGSVNLVPVAIAYSRARPRILKA